MDSLLLGLWRIFYFSKKNHFILHDIQKAYSMKYLNVIKAAVMRWLSHGAACKRCRERCGMILGSLDGIITRKPRPQSIGYCDEMLNAQTVLQIIFFHLKSFRAYQDVFSQIKLFAKQNILAKHTRKKLRVDHLIFIEEFHENIDKSF